jgi:uncharacterized protein
MREAPHWRLTAGLGLAFVLVTFIAALATKFWVLTALPIGFLFGFFLRKGDLCGSSAFSEVILDRDWSKFFGLWTCVVVSMLGFAVGDLLGLISLNPKPMFWLNFGIGGIVFGVGTVLAGGCISGCLYKGATGNLNSIAALVTMPAGIALVEYGPSKSLSTAMKTYKISLADGAAVSLHGVTGLPFFAWALIIAGATLGVVLWRNSRKDPMKTRPVYREEAPLWKRLLLRPWRPWQAGVAIGLLALFAYMSSASVGRNYPFGVTKGVLHGYLLVTESDLNHVHGIKFAKPSETTQAGTASQQTPPAKPTGEKKIVWWLVLLVGSLMLGAFTSGKLGGQVYLLPKPPEQTLIAMFGGVLVGCGAALAMGCVVGNIMSGWALLSFGTFLFGITTILSNWATTYFYLMGGTLFGD